MIEWAKLQPKSTVDQRSGANLKNVFFAKFCCKFLAFFSFFAEKTLKMTISTSVWSAQHPNAGQNIQQPRQGVVIDREWPSAILTEIFDNVWTLSLLTFRE